MAEQLPTNLYSGGAVTFNSQPYTNFYLQSMAKKRAKEEALDNYFRDFNKTINPAGMRNQDIEGWMGKTKDYEDFFYKNKAAILSPRLDNGKAQSEYMARHQDLLADAQRSKNLGEVSKQYVVPLQTNPDKSQRVTDGAMNAIHSHDLSMYDPNHKELDPSTLDFDAKPFDIKAQQQFTKYLTGGLKMSDMVTSVKSDPKTHENIITHDLSFGKDDLKTIGDRAAYSYMHDPSFKASIDDMKHDPDMFEQLNEQFKSISGKNIESDEDFASAYGLSLVQQNKTTQKTTGFNPFLSPYPRMEYGYELGKQMYDYKNQMDSQVLDKAWQDVMGEAQKYPTTLNERGKQSTIYTMPATSEFKEAFSYKDDKGKIVYPSWIRVMPDKSIKPIFFQYNEDGSIKKGADGKGMVDENKSVAVPEQVGKIMYGNTLFGQSMTNKQVVPKEKSNEPPQIKSKTKTITKKKDSLGLF